MAKPRTLEGYKGSTRNFMAPVSESKFSGDKFKFTDEDDNFVNYVMNNKAGKPIQKNEILNLAEGNVIYPQNLQSFSGLSYFTVQSSLPKMVRSMVLYLIVKQMRHSLEQTLSFRIQNLAKQLIVMENLLSLVCLPINISLLHPILVMKQRN